MKDTIKPFGPKRARGTFRFHGLDVECGMYIGIDAIGPYATYGDWDNGKMIMQRSYLTGNGRRCAEVRESNSTTDAVCDMHIAYFERLANREELREHETARNARQRAKRANTDSKQASAKIGLRDSWKYEMRGRKSFGTGIKPEDIPDREVDYYAALASKR